MRTTLWHLFLVAALGSGLSAGVAEAQLQINEDFAAVPPPNWVILNHSQPVGAVNWFQGNIAVFPAQGGATNSYAGANFNSTGNVGDISDWLLTPQVDLANGTTLTFYTRKVAPDQFADRLQVRLSTNGASMNVGVTAADVGDFTTLLLDINPTLVLGVYPTVWTQFTITLSGLPPGLNSGRVAFRYFVTNGGFSGANSDYIGVDTVTLTGVVTADLSITKTDGQANAVPGAPVTYTIVAANAGPNGVTGATVADTLPAAITGATWSCVGAGGGTCSAVGSGNINDSVNLPAGASVTYTLMGTISASATGTLSNTATVTAPVGITDPNPANNSATDIDTLTPQADLSITKTDGQTSAIPGSPITYTIVAMNAGPSNAPGATVADTVPAAITGATWSCVGAGGGTCSAVGSGNINDTANLPAGGSVTYTLTGTLSPSATGTLTNTATVSAPGGVTDPNPGNNSATDTDTVPGLSYFTLPPCRLVDTRGGAPNGGPVMQAQETRTLAVAGNCGIPLTAKAISINVAVTQPTVAGNVRLFPAGQTLPVVSSITYGAGQTRANNGVVALNAQGNMDAFAGQATGTVHVIVDVNGYFEY